MKLRSLSLGAAAAALLVAGAPAFADASSEQYRGCDGYGAASREGDGMTEYASILFIFNPVGYGNTSRSKTAFGAAAIADCDAALSDLPKRHWMRKVSLLRARALHDLETKDTASAVADLDKADAAATEAGGGDKFYIRSLGWGLNVTRAYLLHLTGDQAKAVEMAQTAAAQRPYNRQTLYSAMLAMGGDADPVLQEKSERDMAKLVPALIDTLFVRAFNVGRYGEAEKLYGQLTLGPDYSSMNAYGDDALSAKWRTFRREELFRATRAGMYAYVLAALGRNGEAKTTIDAARAKLAADTVPPPPLTVKQAKFSDNVARHKGEVDIREVVTAEGKKYLDLWETLSGLRIALNEGRTADVSETLKTYSLPKNQASVDILEALAARQPKKQQPAAQQTAQELKTVLEKANVAPRETTPAAFYDSMPEAESQSRIPDFSEGGHLLFGLDSGDNISGDGFRVGKPDADGVRTIRYRGTFTIPPSVAEEMSLLCAADFARQQGKKGLIIVGRTDIKTTVTTTYYTMPVRNDPGGYETRLDVAMVDPAALPDKYKEAAWRLLDADAIYDALAPYYIKEKKQKRK